jgi:mevalonate kinase
MNELMIAQFKQDVQTIKDDVKEIKELLKELHGLLKELHAVKTTAKKGVKHEGN